MNNLEKLNLQKMIKEHNIQDNTENIRKLKHSVPLAKDVNHLLFLKKKFLSISIDDPEKFNNMCISNCRFLYDNYTDIFNKIKKDEIDINLLYKFLEILKNIEDGIIDQHEGSFQVGSILKNIYIDSALKKGEKLDKKHDNKKSIKKEKEKNISWFEYKNNLINSTISFS